MAHVFGVFAAIRTGFAYYYVRTVYASIRSETMARTSYTVYISNDDRLTQAIVAYLDEHDISESELFRSAVRTYLADVTDYEADQE